MSEPALTHEDLRHAHARLSQLAHGDVDVAAKVLGEVLLAQAEQRTAAVSHALVSARMAAHGATDATAEVEGLRPLEVLRRGPRTAFERALVSVLMARHVGALLDGAGGGQALAPLLAGLDWLEFTGPYVPYSAARATLRAETRARLEALLAAAPVEAASPQAVAAVRTLRGLRSESAAPDTLVEPLPAGRAGTRTEEPVAAALSLAGDLEGVARGALSRALGVLSGWALVRGAARAVGAAAFSLRSPVTIALDGSVLRIVGHAELLGRTLRTFELRYPLIALVEVRREERYPGLPVAAALVGLATGALLGARAAIEGAGAVYFPLIALGIAAVLGGMVFELLLRALWPGVRGRTRLTLRARGIPGVVLTNLAPEELDQLLDAVDKRLGDRALNGPAPSASAATALADRALTPPRAGRQALER